MCLEDLCEDSEPLVDEEVEGVTIIIGLTDIPIDGVGVGTIKDVARDVARDQP